MGDTQPYGEHAFDYHDAGWSSVFPLPARKKDPPPDRWTGRHGGWPSREQVDEWVARNPSGNIALRIPPGVIGIDVDAYGDKQGGTTFAELETECGPLPTTTMSTSRDDGVSGIRLYRVPDDFEAVGALPGIELLQPHHRYAVVWPSVHPEGRTYRWVRSDTGEPAGIPDPAQLPELPEAWQQRLMSWSSGGTDKEDLGGDETRRLLKAWSTAGMPCTHVTQAHDDTVALLNEGIARHDTCNENQLYLLRLGEQGHPGVHTALKGLRDAFYTAIDGDRDGSGEWNRGLTGAVAVVAGDPTAENKHGCGEKRDEPAGSTKAAEDVEWGSPLLFTRDSLPSFPLDVFGWFAPHARAIADYFQAPADLVGMLTLAVTAATVRGRVRVRRDVAYTQPLNIYVAVILNPAEMKSPVLEFLSRPLRDIEQERVQEAEPVIREAKRHQRIVEKKVARFEKQAAEGKIEMTEAIEAAKELDEIEVPVEPQLLADDVTPEGLIRVLHEQSGVIAALSAEGGIFATMLGRYARGVPNLDPINKAHDAEPIVVNRKTDDTLRISAPRLTLGLAVQPEVVKKAMESEAARGLGLMGRFCYSVPTPMVGKRHFQHSDSALTAVTVNAESAVYDLVRRVDQACERSTVTTDTTDVYKALSNTLYLSLSSSTARLFTDYINDWEKRSDSSDSAADLSDVPEEWSGKQRGRVLRLAGLLHLIRGSEPGQSAHEINESVLRDAIHLGDYLAAHAITAYGTAGASANPERAAQQLLNWLLQKGHHTFTVRTAHRGLHGRKAFERVSQVQAACDELVERSCVRLVSNPRDPKRGGPPRSPIYEVNPQLFDLAEETCAAPNDPPKPTSAPTASSGGTSNQNPPSLTPSGAVAGAEDPGHDRTNSAPSTAKPPTAWTGTTSKDSDTDPGGATDAKAGATSPDPAGDADVPRANGELPGYFDTRLRPGDPVWRPTQCATDEETTS